ncbi:MAG TPA: chemotaxis protein CheA [Thermoanaerobaculia bacterium]|nr:chemotaxis protein CheA [Thermoanaerobaculia bacterium]
MTTMDIDISAVTREFVIEGLDLLDQMEKAVMDLEDRPGDAELIRIIFRGAHTLKGNASCLSFDNVTHAAHSFEDTVESLAQHTIEADSKLTTLLLRMVDEFREWLPVVAEHGDQPRPSAMEACSALGEWARARRESSPQTTGSSAISTPAAARALARTLRVDVERLDRMANLAGELAIARGRLGRSIEDSQSAELLESFAETERLALQLQELVTRVRMVPVGTVFRPFIRNVRDLAAGQNKKARLVIVGADVEVDLSVVEHLRDPLMHMIRNAVDHGIESPDERRAKNKPAEGKITLTARHEGGSIIIDVHDDGRGLDRKAIVRKARELGMPDADQLPDREVYRLILEPGFSTAENVTELSGRGVGLDVVRRNVEALRGSIDLDNDQGAVFTLRLPLTLAIIDGFAVGVASETYILPVDAVVECLDLASCLRGPRPEAQGLIEVRGEPLPYLDLGSAFASSSKPRHVVVVQALGTRIGLAVDELEGQSQTVIKPLGKLFERVREFSGSSILSDGRVALLLDVTALVQRVTRRKHLQG